MGRFHGTLEKFRSFVYRGVFNVSLGMLFCSPRQRGRVSSAASVFHLFTPTYLSSRQVDEESQTRDPSWGVPHKLWESVIAQRQVLRRTLSKTFLWHIFISPGPPASSRHWTACLFCVTDNVDPLTWQE